MPEHSQLLFPIIRKFSSGVTPLLLHSPLSANQVTTLSLLCGLLSAGLFATGRPNLEFAGALALLACYVLDNCDGEVARGKGQCSSFGAFYDSLVDWLVHTAFFVGLGIGAARATDDNLWFWLGLIAGAGGTVNYFLGRYLDRRDRQNHQDDHPTPVAIPATVSEWLLYAFRELARADFCFIVLALAAFNLTWVLLPAGAIGAQVYWLTQFVRVARRFHV